MIRWFWPLFVLNAVFAGLVLLALPRGADFVYAVMAGSQLGMLFLLARAQVAPRMDEQPKQWDHS